MTPSSSDTIRPNGIGFSHEDIHKVVDDFYTRVAKDDLLQVPFGSVHNWPEHIARMTHFWWMRLGGPGYIQTTYNPVQKHFTAGFNSEFLKRWLTLFHETLVKNLKTEQVELWSSLAHRMGQALSMKNEYLLRMSSQSPGQ